MHGNALRFAVHTFQMTYLCSLNQNYFTLKIEKTNVFQLKSFMLNDLYEEHMFQHLRSQRTLI